MNILTTTSSFSERDNEYTRKLQAAGATIIHNPLGKRLSEADALTLFSQYNPVGVVAGVETLSRAVLASAPALKAIARCGTGMDSLDVNAARDFSIAVSNTPDAPAAAVSELALALMLNVLRRVAEADRHIRAAAWKPLTGGLLSARTIGLIGYGRIGRRVAKLTSAFGARVLAFDPLARDTEGAQRVTLDELLAQANIVSLHAPPDAVFLGAAEFARMPRGAIVINTARGTLIDEAALDTALESGHLAGAGLDVFHREPYSGPLSRHENVVLTAHMGSYAAEGRSMQELESLANLVQDLTLAGIIK